MKEKQRAEEDVLERGLAFEHQVRTMVEACSGGTLAPALRLRGDN